MRKLPQQERSRQMVSTLIEATARCIAERGLDNTSTPIIAERAGVSVGSLYQYFSSKDALIEAMVAQLANDIGTGLSRLPIAPEASLRDLVSVAIRFGFATLHSQDGLYSPAHTEGGGCFTTALLRACAPVFPQALP